MAVSKRLRYEVLRRDNFACKYCGATAPDVKLTVDHVTPEALGGSDDPSNLVAACGACNGGKTSTTPNAATVADVSTDALRWSAALAQAAENLREQEKPKVAYREAFLAEWNRRGYGEGDERKPATLPGGWKAAIERFRTLNLPEWVWEEIVDTAMGYSTVRPENKFKYCCGMAWKKVKAMQEDARSILGEAPAAHYADFDIDSIDDLVAEAALLAWGQEWAMTFKEGPTPEQADVFKASAHEAISAGRKPAEVLEAAEYAVWFGCGTAQEGLEQLDRSNEFNKQYVAHSAFTAAWTYACGESPSEETIERLWNDCEKLYEAGAHPNHVALAAAIAGLHATTRMYVCLSEEGLKAIDVQPGLQRAEDLWAVAWKNTSPGSAWPTEDDREAFRLSVKQIGGAHRYWYRDVYAAAVRAGAYQDPDLSFHLTCADSALDVAGFALPGGGV